MRYGDKYALVLLIILGAVYTAYRYRRPPSPVQPVAAKLTAVRPAADRTHDRRRGWHVPLPVTALADPDSAAGCGPGRDATKPPVVNKQPTVKRAEPDNGAKTGQVVPHQSPWQKTNRGRREAGGQESGKQAGPADESSSEARQSQSEQGTPGQAAEEERGEDDSLQVRHRPPWASRRAGQ